MVVEVDNASQLDEFLRVLKLRLWFILVPAALIITAGVAFAVLVPKKFVSSSKVMLLETEGDGNNSSTKEGRVAEHTIKSPARIEAVIQDLGWDDYLGLSVAEEQVYLDRVLGNLRVETPPMDLYAGRQLVRAEFKHTDAKRARDFLGELMKRWRMEVLEKRHREVDSLVATLSEQRSESQRQISSLVTKISQLQSQFGIPPATVDQNGRPHRAEAAEFEMLKLTKEMLWELEQKISGMQAVLDGMRARHDAMDDTVSEDRVLADSETDRQIMALTMKKEKAEELILLQGWTPDHSYYKRAIIQIQTLESEIDALRQSAGDTIEEVFDQKNKLKIQLALQIEDAVARLEREKSRENDLVLRVESLEQETQELQDAYGELDVMTSEKQITTRVLDETRGELERARRQKNVLDGPAGNPFDILEEPTQPTRPTDPDPVLIIIFAIFAGTAVGLGLAVVLEYSKNCFRSPGDLSRVMVIPILGTVNKMTTKSERRKSFALRAVLGLSTGAFVLSVGYITWAFMNRPEALPEQVLTAVTDFQEAFK
jgi:uncharacterized protein involved in exopolysaccharide biosynthesis